MKRPQTTTGTKPKMPSIGFWPRTDYKTKQTTQGMESAKLTAEDIAKLQALTPGDRLFIFENSYLKDSPKGPHLKLTIPAPRPKTTDSDDSDF